MKKDKRAFLILLVCLTVVLPGCASVSTPSGFLGDYSRLQPGQYFKQEYIAPDAYFGKYSKVKVDPVELKHFDNSANQYDKEKMEELGSKLKTALEDELGKRYEVLSVNAPPDRETVIIRPALVYVAEPERLLNLATAFFIYIALSKGAAAFEAKLIDGGTKKELAAVSEKRKAGGGIRDAKSILIGNYMRFTHAEGAFKRWGKNLLDLMAYRGGKP